MPATTSNPTGRVAVVGTLNVDLVWRVPRLPRPGETVLASATERQFGGKGANQAVAAARQGARVALLGAVGDDAEGRLYREHLEREGMDTRLVRTAGAVPTGTAHVYVDADGENLIAVDRGANAHIDTHGLATLLPQIDVLLVQLECALEPALEALRLAATAGVRTILNASPAVADFPWGRQPIDTVVVNEHECVETFGLSASELGGWRAAPRHTWLAERALRHVVITQGSEPTWHIAADSVQTTPTFTVQPVDTVGAGDTFAGALAAELAAGRDWPAALWYANVAAALATQALGAQAAIPRRVDVERALEQASAARR